jgi:uncharacterized protein YndB with AHSA1/START domain
MEKQIKQTWDFSCSPEQVWLYLTEPALMEQWLMKCNFRPEVGYTFQFTFTESEKNKYAGVVECEVLEVKPPQRLSYTWNGKLKDGSRSFSSIVIWILHPQKDGTQLELLHKGFELEEDLLIHKGGWDSCVNKLDKLLKPAV